MWSKGILELRFGPNLGLGLEGGTKLNNIACNPLGAITLGPMATINFHIFTVSLYHKFSITCNPIGAIILGHIVIYQHPFLYFLLASTISLISPVIP